jgi:hypothetical protein
VSAILHLVRSLPQVPAAALPRRSTVALREHLRTASLALVAAQEAEAAAVRAWNAASAGDDPAWEILRSATWLRVQLVDIVLRLERQLDSAGAA